MWAHTLSQRGNPPQWRANTGSITASAALPRQWSHRLSGLPSFDQSNVKSSKISIKATSFTPSSDFATSLLCPHLLKKYIFKKNTLNRRSNSWLKVVDKLRCLGLRIHAMRVWKVETLRFGFISGTFSSLLVNNRTLSPKIIPLTLL